MRRQRELEEGKALESMQGELLEICQVSMVADHVLRVDLNGPSLRYVDLLWLVECLARSKNVRSLREVILDFDQIKVIKAPWTAVLALLIGFAERSDFRCRIISIHGQPANVVRLYYRNRELGNLLRRTETLETEDLRQAG